MKLLINIYFLLITFSFGLFSQNCPEDINNSPGNSEGTVIADVYDGEGNIVQTINCESTGNSSQIDCDLQSYNFPSDYFMILELTNGANSTSCAYNADGELISMNPLPIELIDFNGSVKNGYHNLNWSTASESNSSHYEIFCSYDGINWTKIGQKSAAGTTDELSIYSYEHRPKFPGLVYYKVIQYDFSGVNKTLGIISLKNQGVDVSVVGNDIQVKSDQDIKEVSVTSMMGRLIHKSKTELSDYITISPSSNKTNNLVIVVVHTTDGAYFKEKILY